MIQIRRMLFPVLALLALMACVDRSSPQAIVRSAGKAALDGNLKEYRACFLSSDKRSDAQVLAEAATIRQTLKSRKGVRVESAKELQRGRDQAWYQVAVTAPAAAGTRAILYTLKVVCSEGWSTSDPNCDPPRGSECYEHQPIYRSDCWIYELTGSSFNNALISASE